MFGRSDSKNGSRNKAQSGFTIVELLIVIVIIGILAAITIVSYTGITKRANDASVQAELTNASKKLAIYYTLNNTYPTALDPSTGCPTAPISDTDNCVKVKAGTTLSYYGNAKNFSLSISNSNSNATIANDFSPKTLSLAAPTDCPAGYIPVPGSLTYGTSGFCVMKYEAKNDGSNNAVSTAAGTPYVNINQTDAATKSAAACTGCHLITEAEWMTLAQNVLSVASNWSGGAVGSGYIYSGHNDNAPASALVAGASDANGYANETNTGGNQKRTLTLTNGQVIWDLAGNVWEWTNGQTTGNQPGGTTAGYGAREWNALGSQGSLTVNPNPAGTGISGAASWTGATNGIGQIYSDSGQAALRGFIRGGDWNGGANAGVSALDLRNAPSNLYTGIGFRVSR